MSRPEQILSGIEQPADKAGFPTSRVILVLRHRLYLDMHLLERDVDTLGCHCETGISVVVMERNWNDFKISGVDMELIAMEDPAVFEHTKPNHVMVHPLSADLIPISSKLPQPHRHRC